MLSFGDSPVDAVNVSGSQSQLRDRREFLRNGLGLVAGLSAFNFLESGPRGFNKDLLGAELKSFLLNVREKSIEYFLENRTCGGLVLDRASNKVSHCRAESTNPHVTSVSATGYGLSAIALACNDGVISEREGRKLTEKTLSTISEVTPAKHRGWLYHFIDSRDGKRALNSEISTVDTLLFYLGAFAAAEYFGGAVKDTVYSMFEKVDFEFVLNKNGSEPGAKAFSHGFYLNESSTSFISSNWGAFSEGILVPLLSLGSPQDINTDVWLNGWQRNKTWSFKDLVTFDDLPLFTYYYSLGYLDLKGRSDALGDNFWDAARSAVLMQQEYCRENGYPAGVFGITACDGPKGYMAYYPGHNYQGKVIAPLAMLAGGIIVPETKVTTFHELKRLGLLEGRYGTPAAYDLETGWIAPETLGIDVGSTLLMLDIEQSGLIHKLLSQSAVIQKAMLRSGLRSV